MYTRIVMTVLLLPLLGGCSLLFTSGPPPEADRSAAFSCTTSYVAPALDIVTVGYLLAVTAGENQGSLSAQDIALSTLWFGSAGYGVWNVRRCKGAIEAANRNLSPPDSIVGGVGPYRGVAILQAWPEWHPQLVLH